MCALFQLLEFILITKLQSHQNEAVNNRKLDPDGLQKLCSEEYIFCQFENVFSWVQKSFWSAEGICAQGNLTMAKFERFGKRTASSNFLFSFILNSFFAQGNVPKCRKSLTNGFVPPVYHRRNSQRKKIPHRRDRLKCTKAFLCTGPQHRLKAVVHACSSSNKIASVV